MVQKDMAFPLIKRKSRVIKREGKTWCRAEKGFITNRLCQELNDVGKKTAYLELSGLVEKGLLLSTGKGRSVRYVARF